MYRIIGSDGREYGPVEAEQIKKWIADGRVNAATKVRAEGMPEWKALSEFPELMGRLATTPRTPPVMGTEAWRPPVKDQVKGPATGLIVTAVLGFVVQALAFLGNLFGISQGFQGANPDAAFTFFTGTIGNCVQRYWSGHRNIDSDWRAEDEEP